jgi:glycosyltransferase involved in cell wall biosynthesis
LAISAYKTAYIAGAGYDPSTIVALPNGVPVPDTPWRPRPDWHHAPRALYVGRLAPEKGLDLLIEAWPTVRVQFPQAQLTLIGEGPERSALAARITHLDLADVVEMPGACPDPSPWLLAADLFVLPSREEGMSIALLEAMALGIPLVASAIPGNRHLIADGEHGRLAPAGGPAAWARTILDHWGHFDHAVQMGRAARQRVARDYSIAGVARKHLDLFHALIEEHAHRPRPSL